MVVSKPAQLVFSAVLTLVYFVLADASSMVVRVFNLSTLAEKLSSSSTQ